jgi:hypothetical protein
MRIRPGVGGMIPNAAVSLGDVYSLTEATSKASSD